MDDQGGAQGAPVAQPQQPEPSVNDRLLNILGGEDEPEQEAEAAPQDTADEAPEQPAEEAEPEFDIEWNGEAKKLRLSELREYAQKGYDYTRKTQHVSSQAQQLELQRQALAQREQIMGALQDQVLDHQLASRRVKELMSEDLSALAQTDPLGALTKQIELQKAQMAAEEAAGKLRQSYSQLQQQQQAQREQFIQREFERAVSKIPEWRNQEARAKDAAGLREYLSSEGFGDHEIAGLSDHRALVMARKAMLYDRLQAKGPEVSKRVAEAGKAPPKAATSMTSAQVEAEKLRSRLKKTGDMKDAAALILARMK